MLYTYKLLRCVSVPALLFLLTACGGEQQPATAGELRPEIAAFVAENPMYGPVEDVETLPNWAKGERQRIRVPGGTTYLFYTQQGQVVTIYREEGGGRFELYRNDLPEPPKNVGPRPATAMLPAYQVLDTVDLMAGGRAGDILVSDYSRATPPEIREQTLRAVMQKEGFTQASLYCSEDARRANMSASFAETHPTALETCFLGSIQNGTFTPGEAIFPN